MKIVDETGNKMVLFGDLNIGDAFEHDHIAWRKIARSAAAPISKNRIHPDQFGPQTYVVLVEYDITVKVPAKKGAAFKDVPQGGVFRCDGDLFVKVGSVSGRMVSDFNRVEHIPENYPVHPVNATLTIRDAE